MEVYLDRLQDNRTRDDFSLYSESQGRIVVTINPKHAFLFEKKMKGTRFAHIGTIRDDDKFIVHGKENKITVDTRVTQLLDSYTSTFRGY